VSEIEALSQLHKINVVTVTEVQAQSPGLLKINNCSQIIKPRPHNHPLGKKGDGILLFVGDYLIPKVIHTPNRSDYDEIIWASVRPKFLPRPFNLTVFGAFIIPQIKMLHKDSGFSRN